MLYDACPATTQYARLLKDLNAFLPAGSTGWISPNKTYQQIPDSDRLPDFIFHPAANTDLAFLVFADEVETITRQ